MTLLDLSLEIGNIELFERIGHGSIGSPELREVLYTALHRLGTIKPTEEEPLPALSPRSLGKHRFGKELRSNFVSAKGSFLKNCVSTVIDMCGTLLL